MNPRHLLPALFLFLLIAYPLSTGPVTAWYYWAEEKDRIEWAADNFKKADRHQRIYDYVTPFYAPLSWMTWRSRTFRHALDWYQWLWTPVKEQVVF